VQAYRADARRPYRRKLAHRSLLSCQFSIVDCRLKISSCEPCPLCLSAALWARVDAVVYAADRHDAARGGFDDREFYDLFARPRETWDLPVRQVPLPSSTGPFAAWLAKADRVDY
jgi:tRNA(Arg) A34 adenosine deaminase TadA